MFEGALNCLPDPVHADLGQEIAARLDVLPADCFIPREENPLNTEVRVRNADFIRSPYFQSLKTDALCVEPQSRKIVFKTAAAFGESDYDQNQAAGFINLWGLPTKVQALREQGKL